ncbi:MFS transporter [Candidatus Woesearchaeota archaeon]|nr:MFS transporter [Candidatus Woesearchaeota archaeon]
MILKNLKLPSLSKTVRRNYRLDSIASVLEGLFAASVFPFAAVIAVRLGASPWLVSLLVAGTYLGKAFTIPAAALMGGRRKFPFLIWPGFMMKAVLLWTAFIIEPLLFVCVFILFYLFENFTGVAYVSLVHAIYPDKVRGRLTSRVWFYGTVATLFASLGAGYLLDILSYRIVFPAAAVMGLVSLMFYMHIRVKEPVERRRSWESLMHIFDVFRKDRKYCHFLAAYSFAEVGFILILPLFPLFLVNTLNISNFQMGILTAIQSLFMVLSMLLWGKRIDERGPYRVVLESFAFVIPAPLFFFFSHSIWTVWPAFLLFGITSGGAGIAIINLMGRFTTKKRITDYYSLNQTVGGARGVIIPFISALLVTYISIRYAFLIAFFVLLVGVFTLYLADRSFSAKA